MNDAKLSDTVDFLVVGAGLAGLAFAQDATNMGKTVCVIDKGRGVGGRMATRRLEGNVRVDHGAQFFTARGSRFEDMVKSGLADGTIMEWSRGFPQWKNGVIETRPPGHPRYACPQGMSQIPKMLAQNVDVQTGAQAAKIEKKENVYQVTCANGRVFTR